MRENKWNWVLIERKMQILSEAQTHTNWRKQTHTHRVRKKKVITLICKKSALCFALFEKEFNDHCTK